MLEAAFGNTGPQTRVWPSPIVMIDPLPKNGAKVTLRYRNDEVQTLATDRADQPLTKCVRLWHASRRFKDCQPHHFERAIDAFRENRVAIVDHEAMDQIARHNHSKLLRGPVRGRMLCQVAMEDSSGPNFQDNKHVDHAECSGYDDEEITAPC